MLRRLRASPIAPTLGYVVVATVALPFIVFGVGYHVSGFDCADLSWADDASLAERDAIYRNLGRNVRVVLVAVAAAAAIPLGASILRTRDGKTSGSPAVAAVAAVGLWALYGLAFLVSLWLFTCDGQSL